MQPILAAPPPSRPTDVAFELRYALIRRRIVVKSGVPLPSAKHSHASQSGSAAQRAYTPKPQIA